MVERERKGGTTACSLGCHLCGGQKLSVVYSKEGSVLANRDVKRTVYQHKVDVDIP